jgi:hypothetical protein
MGLRGEGLRAHEQASQTFRMDLIYIDESGDHAKAATNPQYPVFVVVACIFDCEVYTRRFGPALLEFKLKHWKHEAVILHEREIRKYTGDFAFLFDRGNRQRFLTELSALIRQSGAKISAVAWDKRKTNQTRTYADCLVRLLQSIDHGTPGDKGQRIAIVESRGPKEDQANMRAAERAGLEARWKLVFVPKARNIPGLQLADLCARPIGLKVMAPERPNRAFDETIRLLLFPSPNLETGDLIVLD